MSRKTVILKPKAGIRVRDPKTTDVLPPEGKRVELNSYWSRRLSEGCVEIIQKSEPKLKRQGA